MKKKHYKYNEDQFTYDEVKLTKSELRKRLPWYLLFALIFMALFAFIYFNFIDTAYEKTLKKQNEELKESAQFFGQSIDSIRNEIVLLNKFDNDLHKNLFKQEVDTLLKQEKKNNEKKEKANNLSLDYVLSISKKIENIKAKIKDKKYTSSVLEKISQEKARKMQSIPSIRPLKGDIICGFGMYKNPIYGGIRKHTGIDFSAAIGTPVMATGNGKVLKYKAKDPGGGKEVVIDHGFGYQSKYSHLSKIIVKPFQTVKRGDIIGYSGNSGLSKGPHLHYEILKSGKPINPIEYFYADLSSEEYEEFKAQAKQSKESFD